MIFKKHTCVNTCSILCHQERLYPQAQLSNCDFAYRISDID